MELGIKSHVSIQSEDLISKILGSNNISHLLYLSSNDPPSHSSGVSQNPTPLYFTSAPSIISERIDDISLLVSILLKLNLPKTIDKYYTPHGNHQGLSHGWLLTVWLVYMLSRSDHRMNSVQDWVAGRSSVLANATGQKITDKDFTDDRLANILKMLYDDTLWSQIEQHISQHTIRAYNLTVKKVRLDATTAAVNHDPEKHPLFQVGRTKQNTYQPQFKLMLGALDPLGLPIATDVVSGEKADDPLYVPIYKRIHNSLDQSGILYIGDSKMGSIETRAVIDNDGNFYLMPLPMTGETPALLDTILSELEAGEHETENVFLPKDIPEDPNKAPDPKLAIARGFEITIERKTVIDGEDVIWNERVCCVQSFSYAVSQNNALVSRLKNAEKALQNLTPPPGRGKKQYQDEEKLKGAADKVLKRYKVQGLIDYTTERQESHKNIRAYGGKPARVETIVRFQIDINRNNDNIEQAKRGLGWRLYAINATSEELSLTQVVLTYRDQYIVERDFSHLKTRLGITPLYVQRDDHACGLIRLLTIALRAMCIIEYSARQKLLENQDLLQGIYPGNPSRSTESPSADLMLKAFNGLDFYITNLPNGQHFEQISPLNDVQKKILYLLDLPEKIYSNIAKSPQYGL